MDTLISYDPYNWQVQTISFNYNLKKNNVDKAKVYIEDMIDLSTLEIIQKEEIRIRCFLNYLIHTKQLKRAEELAIEANKIYNLDKQLAHIYMKKNDLLLCLQYLESYHSKSFAAYRYYSYLERNLDHRKT